MEFSTGPYYTPMERAEGRKPEAPRLERPIVPISELGSTVPEKDPVTGAHLIQNIDAYLRQGVRKLQIVMSTPSHSPMGGRPKAYGEEYRESVRELARANDLQIEGVEMPTSSMGNLSGYDQQNHSINEHKRQMDIQEVKDAIKFVADVAGGGGVDIWSQEFHRDVYDAKWNQQGKWKDAFEAYEGEEQYATAYVVDKRTGRMQPIMKGQPIFEPEYVEAEKEYWGKAFDGKTDVLIKRGDWVTEDGRLINPENEHELLLRKPKWNRERSEFKIKELSWDELKQKVNRYNERHNTQYTPEEFAIRTQLDNQILQSKGQSLYYSRNYEDHMKQLQELRKSLEYYKKLEAQMPEEEMWRIARDDPAFAYGLASQFVHAEKMKPTEVINKLIYGIEHDLKHIHEASSAADARAEEMMRQKNNMVSLSKYALQKSIDAYADLGIEAMNETMTNKHVNRPIHVGPESGWPQAYGGHPEEFIELIQKARERMAQKLQTQGYSKESAMEKAKVHIKGTFDTSHVGMWLNNFKKKQGESEEQRVKRFKTWYMDMVDKMSKADVIGGIQAVDSATGAHGHLPVGQGFLGQTVVEAVDKLKSEGWNGFIVSEGHEEEQYGRGRILTQTWKAFGADIGGGFFDRPTDWGSVEGSYFGHSNPPPYILGSYSPSEDYRGAPFWSGLPLD
ncbi:TPA: hypothetical protein HA265_04825 [Candidatus Woesearchaeota archaeon]|nr:hypothetical protein [Candidatus Woesearchaeota archaeon]